MSIVLRAKTTSSFGLGRQFTSPRVAEGQTFTVPEAKVTAPLLASIRTLVASGKLEVVSSLPAHGLGTVRNIASRNQLHITLGLDQGSGVLLPNGATVHKLKLGGVPFLLGDGNIDGSSTSTLLTAFLAALAASTDFAATGAAVRASATLALPAAVAATVTLTSDNTVVSDGATITIAGKTYTARTTLTPTEGEVLINSGGGADAFLLNLIRAINHTGTPGTDYSCAAAHPTVSAAASVTAHAFLITALTAGSAGNALASTETSTHLSFSTDTLVGGSDTQALVIIDGSGVLDWEAFEAATSLKDVTNVDLSTPYMGLTFFDATTHDTVNADSIVYASRTVTSADVTRGYIAFDTGLTDLATKYAVRITRSGSRVLHDGTLSILGTQSLLIQNDGSVDFQAADVVQIFAAGAD